jgi:hypothetical protein
MQSGSEIVLTRPGGRRIGPEQSRLLKNGAAADEFTREDRARGEVPPRLRWPSPLRLANSALAGSSAKLPAERLEAGVATQGLGNVSRPQLFADDLELADALPIWALFPRAVIVEGYGGPAMSTVWNALDNREKALLFWVAALVAGGLATRAGREFVRTMLDILRGRFSLIVLTYILYVAGVVFGLASVGLWTTGLASATAFWLAGPGMVMFFTSNTATTHPHYLRSIVRRALWLLLGVEFVVNMYVFPLAVEILLVPVLTVIAVFGFLSPDTEGASEAKRFSEAVLAGFGIVLFMRFAVGVAKELRLVRLV